MLFGVHSHLLGNGRQTSSSARPSARTKVQPLDDDGPNVSDRLKKNTKGVKIDKISNVLAERDEGKIVQNNLSIYDISILFVIYCLNIY